MKLILNRHARGNERFVSANQTLSEIREEWLAIISDDCDDSDVCTFSPIVADLFVRSYRDGAGIVAAYDDVCVFDGERDRPVTEFASAEWMCHFSLGDLYVHGEFEKEMER